jgi:8-oxo-dGTP pyrophosphatase MutT (NUDIX family)
MKQYDHLDFDPDAVEIRHAATVMLVDDRPDLHVLMLKRTAKVVFASANWVFPGGRVDPDDHAADFDRVTSGLTDEEASARLDVHSSGLAWWLAASRETLEECGILLAADAPLSSGDLHDAVLAMRERVQRDEGVFVEELIRHGFVIDATAIEEVARFITPNGPPRRFDARFFVARAPSGQTPQHDASEIVDWEWVRPADALDRWRAGEFEMMSPTVRMVDCLRRYDSADDVMEAARLRSPYRRVRVIDPDGEYRVVLPGEDGYENAALEVESGWVRLWDPTLAE